MNIIVINGQRFEVPAGSNITVRNNTVYVNDHPVKSELSGIVKIVWGGPLANLTCDASVSVNGNVEGSIQAAGSVNCDGRVAGDVSAGGSVNCGSVGGNIRAGGSVNRR